MKEKKIINKLIKNNETISTMESCTAGYLATTLTNVDGSSSALKFSAITYSNEYKIKMGVDAKIIEKYSVYSNETSHDMARAINEFTNSTYSIGITGKINRLDPSNPHGKDNEIFYTIYDSKNDMFYDKSIICPLLSRKKCKEFIVNKVLDSLLEIL